MPLRDKLHSPDLSQRVLCPNCLVDMVVQTVMAVPLVRDFLEITYVCPSCQGETKRWAKARPE